MTEDERKRAAAQRCAQLANDLSMQRPYVADEFLNGGAKDLAFLNAILDLDKISSRAYGYAHNGEGSGTGLMLASHPHILREPQATGVEVLAALCDVTPAEMLRRIAGAGLTLLEVKR